MCGACGDNQVMLPMGASNLFEPHMNRRTGQPCPGEPRMRKPAAPVTITGGTRIVLPEMPGSVFVVSGLYTAQITSEIHLVEENEWRRRRIANGLPVDLPPERPAPAE